jgi:hypothetical protein
VPDVDGPLVELAGVDGEALPPVELGLELVVPGLIVLGLVVLVPLPYVALLL